MSNTNSNSSKKKKSNNLANIIEERKVWLEAHGAMEGAHGPYKIRAEAVDQGHLAEARAHLLTPKKNKNKKSISKIVHFQRHGQGYHNLIFRILEENGMPVTDIFQQDPTKNPFVMPEIRDAPLTELGRLQCAEQRWNVKKLGLQPQLVIVSPLHRALLTAQLTFADSASQQIPFVAHSGCREELGILTCNWRRPLSETQREFPLIDFSLLEQDEGEEDALFCPTEQEAATHQSQRIYDFLVDYVKVQPQEEIAVVGHSAWLFTMCNAVMDCGGDEELASWFGTSEIRSMKLTWEEQEDGDEEGKDGADDD